MKIKRERWAVVTADRKKILCGKSHCMEFRDINNTGNAIIRTYPSKKRAYKSFFQSDAYFYRTDGFQIIKIYETLEEADMKPSAYLCEILNHTDRGAVVTSE